MLLFSLIKIQETWSWQDTFLNFLKNSVPSTSVQHRAHVKICMCHYSKTQDLTEGRDTWKKWLRPGGGLVTGKRNRDPAAKVGWRVKEGAGTHRAPSQRCWSRCQYSTKWTQKTGLSPGTEADMFIIVPAGRKVAGLWEVWGLVWLFWRWIHEPLCGLSSPRTARVQGWWNKLQKMMQEDGSWVPVCSLPTWGCRLRSLQEQTHMWNAVSLIISLHLWLINSRTRSEQGGFNTLLLQAASLYCF